MFQQEVEAIIQGMRQPRAVPAAPVVPVAPADAGSAMEVGQDEEEAMEVGPVEGPDEGPEVKPEGPEAEAEAPVEAEESAPVSPADVLVAGTSSLHLRAEAAEEAEEAEEEEEEEEEVKEESCSDEETIAKKISALSHPGSAGLVSPLFFFHSSSEPFICILHPGSTFLILPCFQGYVPCEPGYEAVVGRVVPHISSLKVMASPPTRIPSVVERTAFLVGPSS